MDEERQAQAIAALNKSLAELADTWDRLGQAVMRSSLRAVEQLEVFERSILYDHSQDRVPDAHCKKSRSPNAR